MPGMPIREEKPHSSKFALRAAAVYFGENP